MTTPAATTSQNADRPHPLHADCIACRSAQRAGLGLRFELQDDGSVVADFPCEPTYQGYCDRVHGGIIATLHDAAMTNCLFHHKVAAFTAKLTIRFGDALRINTPARVRAWIARSSPPGYRLRSEITQNGQPVSTAEGTFCQRTEAAT